MMKFRIPLSDSGWDSPGCQTERTNETNSGEKIKVDNLVRPH